MNTGNEGQGPLIHDECERCCGQLVEIDHYGERLTGCPTCNRWQASMGEWCRLAADDIVALRARPDNGFGHPHRFVHVAVSRVLQGGKTCSKDLHKVAGLLRRYEASGYFKRTWYDRHTVSCRRHRDRWHRCLGPIALC